MAETTYSYTFASFPNQKVAADALSTQIRESSIVTALARVDVNDLAQTCDVVFKDQLSSGDKTTLDGSALQTPNPATPCPPGSLVGDHDGVPLPSSAFRADGVQLVQLEPSGVHSKVRIWGLNFMAAKASPGDNPKSTEHLMIFNGADYPKGVNFQGLEGIWVEAHGADDFMELDAVFPQGGSEALWLALDLGPWPFAPATTAPINVSLFKFGKTVYLPPDGKILPIIAEGTFTIPPGLGLLFTYTATNESALNDPHVTGLVRYWIIE